MAVKIGVKQNELLAFAAALPPADAQTLLNKVLTQEGKESTRAERDILPRNATYLMEGKGGPKRVTAMISRDDFIAGLAESWPENTERMMVLNPDTGCFAVRAEVNLDKADDTSTIKALQAMIDKLQAK